MLEGRVRSLIERAIRAAQAAGDLPPADLPALAVELPQRPEHGDLATPAALALAKPMRRPPRAIAEAIVRHLPADELLASSEIAGSGYVNFRLNQAWLARQVGWVLAQGAGYADSGAGQGRAANVEFVSANPTGPLTVGHGRNAVLGDVLANVLAATGWRVTREYYYNDAGLQMRTLGESLKLRLRQLLGEDAPLADSHYQGAYLAEIARATLAQHGPAAAGRDWSFFKDQARQAIFAEIHATLDRLGIGFDVLSNEASFYENGAIWRVLERLRAAGYAYEQDGATWLRATEFGADKDRVLVRSTGEPTYRLPDIAYHADKLERGFEQVVTVLGIDHIAEAPDIAHALRVLGYDERRLRPLVYQFVTLIRHGEAVKMSTRQANYVTLDELLDEVGADAVRFFMLMRASETPIEFDLDLAKRQSDDNPVYYVQYAHARCCSILRKAAEDERPKTKDQRNVEPSNVALQPNGLPSSFGLGPRSNLLSHPDERPKTKDQRNVEPSNVALQPNGLPSSFGLGPRSNLLSHPAELALIKQILRLGDVLAGCAAKLELHPLTFYARDLAVAFNTFYRDCPVLAAGSPELFGARLQLVAAARQALARALGLMGMAAPEHM